MQTKGSVPALSKAVEELLRDIDVLKSMKSDEGEFDLSRKYDILFGLILDYSLDEYIGIAIKKMLCISIFYPYHINLLNCILKSVYRENLIDAVKSKGDKSWWTKIYLIDGVKNIDIHCLINDEHESSDNLEETIRMIGDYIWLKNIDLLPCDKRIDLHERDIITKIIEKCSVLSLDRNYELAIQAIMVLATITRFVDLSQMEIEPSLLKPKHIEIMLNALISHGIDAIGNIRYFPVTRETIEYLADYVLSEDARKLLKSAYEKSTSTLVSLSIFWAGIFAHIWSNDRIICMANEILINNRLMIPKQSEYRKKMFKYIELVEPREHKSVEHDEWENFKNRFIVLAYTANSVSYKS